MMYLTPKTVLSAVMTVASLVLAAQTEIAPKKERFLYNCGEEAEITVTAKSGTAIRKTGICKVEVKNGAGETVAAFSRDLARENPFSVKVTSDKPGFLRICADGRFAGIGFSPEKIRQALPEPADFDQYWKTLLDRQAQIPDPVTLEPMPDDAGKPGYRYYRVTVKTLDGNHTYGFLGVPKNTKPPYYAYVQVIAAGPGYDGPDPTFIREDMITLALNVHPFDPRDAKEKFQKNYASLGAENRDSYYFRNAVLGCVTAVNWLAKRPDYNGTMVYLGSSQGGGFGLILAGLTNHFKLVSVHVPALSNHGGLLKGQGVGWPCLARNAKDSAARDRILAASAYYDTANFARRVKCPIFFSVGFKDTTCPPDSVYAAYNNVSSPKWIFPMFKDGHGVNWEALNGHWQWCQSPMPDDFRSTVNFFRW